MSSVRAAYALSRVLRSGALCSRFRLAVLSGTLVCAGACIAAAAPAGEPTLYERVALGPLVVHGRCLLGGRRASIEVVTVFKGSYAGSRLFVSYRSDNYNRSPGTAKIEFTPGGESILVLEPEVNDRERVKAPDRFVLCDGARGKIDLPAEGGAALLEAAKRFAAIQALQDQNAVWEAQRALLRESNPHLVRAGFEEVLKFRLGNESILTPLLDHLTGPRPEFRTLALRVLGQIFAAERRKGERGASSDLLVREAMARATGDDQADVRAEAVRALRETGRGDLADSYRNLASRDPSQIVRYEAELALLELRTSASGLAPPRRVDTP